MLPPVPRPSLSPATSKISVPERKFTAVQLNSSKPDWEDEDNDDESVILAIVKDSPPGIIPRMSIGSSAFECNDMSRGEQDAGVEGFKKNVNLGVTG